MLTDRDEAILETLTHRVRMLSAEQVARTWFGNSADPVRLARSRLRQLQEAGYLDRLDALARPELELEEPLFRWEPGEAEPDFAALSRRCSGRWSQPVERTSLYVASSRAGVLYGGSGGRSPRLSEVSHDLSLAGLYLRHFRPNGHRVEWTSEASLIRMGYGDQSRVPDALVTENGSSRAIELGGTYSSAKLEDFHAFCTEEALAYELW